VFSVYNPFDSEAVRFLAGVLRRFPETYRAEGQHRSCKGGSRKIEACESQEEKALVQLKP
jgi:hypothetical protein